MSERLLILETSGRVGCVALADGERMLDARRLDEARRHARDLAPTVAELLKAAGWRPRELNGVIVSRGPGSYTGLRVGIMSAKTLAYATGCALVALDTFAILAAQAPAGAERMDVVADAQQDRLYWQRFQRKGGEWQAMAEMTILPARDWLAQRDGDVSVTGPGLRVIGNRAAGLLVTDETLWEPLPETLLHLGLARYQAGQRDDWATLEPLYARPSSPEEKLLSKKTTRP